MNEFIGGAILLAAGVSGVGTLYTSGLFLLAAVKDEKRVQGGSGGDVKDAEHADD